jgi:hypothetical protein
VVAPYAEYDESIAQAAFDMIFFINSNYHY